jgi:hypothetical protein
MFIDLCQQCFKTVQSDSHLPTKDRQDLISADDMDESVDDEEESNIGDTLDGKDY